MLPSHTAQKTIERWLITCMILVATMVWIGGVTRLSESGLSIVEWKLFSGIFPPLTHSGWQQAFADYQTSPEYKFKNAFFTLSDFKQIFWLEYLHRLLGRITGLVLVLPFIYFSLRKKLPSYINTNMAIACLLVAMQGTVGWIMVKSGLEHDPRVNPFKLALHLSLAFSLFSLLFWTWLSVRNTVRISIPSMRFIIAIRLVTACVILQIVMGALVAGLDAGLTYNTYPLMDGAWIPEHITQLSLMHDKVFANVAFVQFIHRIGAIIVAVSCFALGLVGALNAPPSTRRSFSLLLLALCIQFILGVATLVYVVPLPLASAHQMGALFLLSSLIYINYRIKFPVYDATLTAPELKLNATTLSA